MSERNLSAKEWAEKADYEGGLFNVLFGYGLEYNDLSEEGKASAFGKALRELERITKSNAFELWHRKTEDAMWAAFEGDAE